MTERVTISIDGGVADVRLNRPDKLNALDQHLMAALVAAGQSLAEDRSVRAVVLSGEGRAFCAGLDLAAFQQMAGPPPEESGGSAGDSGGDAEVASGIMATGERETHLGQEAGWVWRRLEVPVIAAITGPCLGGGLQIALGADIRIVAPDAKLSVLEIRWGLLPDMTGLQMLPRLVGIDVAKELSFTGRMVSGEEAVALGLATRTSADPRVDALALAAEIAGKNPLAIRGTKALLNAAGTRPLGDSFLEESRLMQELIGSPNQVEAVMAYFEKRAPVFTD